MIQLRRARVVRVLRLVRRLRLDLVAVRRLADVGFRLELAVRRALCFIVVFLLFPPIPESLPLPFPLPLPLPLPLDRIFSSRFPSAAAAAAPAPAAALAATSVLILGRTS